MRKDQSEREGIHGLIASPAYFGNYEETDPHAPSAQRLQADYIAASGNLSQFNALMSAALTTSISSTTGHLRLAVVGALLLHVLACLSLCWAARPVSGERSRTTPSRAHRELAEDTFKNYRRGWRVTMLGVIASSLALGLYLGQMFGIVILPISN